MSEHVAKGLVQNTARALAALLPGYEIAVVASRDNGGGVVEVNGNYYPVANPLLQCEGLCTALARVMFATLKPEGHEAVIESIAAGLRKDLARLAASPAGDMVWPPRSAS